MKYIILFPIFLFQLTAFGQKLNFRIGMSPTYLITSQNIVFSLEPDYKPTITIEDPRSNEDFTLKSIDWIKTRNYFSLQPSVDVFYTLSDKFSIGLELSIRSRKNVYDVHLPFIVGLPVYTHQYSLNYTFLGTQLLFSYKLPFHGITATISGGLNYPLNKLDSRAEYITIVNQFQITEDVRGMTKSDPFGIVYQNTTAGFALSKHFGNRFMIDLFIEKQFHNNYGSKIKIYETPNPEEILKAVVEGNEINLGIKFRYLILKTVDKKN